MWQRRADAPDAGVCAPRSKGAKALAKIAGLEVALMIHHHFFMPKRADFTQEQFSQYYRYQHIKAAGDQRIPALIRYVQSHRVAEPPSAADFAAVAEVWYESEAALTQFTSSAQYAKFRADELNFVDVSRAENLTTVDHVMLEGERKKGMVKGMFMLKRKPGLTVADFRKHWLEVHAPIALAEMDIRRYVQCHQSTACTTSASRSGTVSRIYGSTTRQRPRARWRRCCNRRR